MARPEHMPAAGVGGLSDPLAEHVQQTLGGDIILKRVLGEGRSARVYLADQPSLGRQVAVKALMPRHTSERKAVARFKREARAMAGCPHPSIVSVYNVGETRNGIPFFVMEHVEGESLADRLRRKGKLPLQEAARIAGALADALAYAVDLSMDDLDPTLFFSEFEGGDAVTMDMEVDGRIFRGMDLQGCLMFNVPVPAELLRSVPKRIVIDRRMLSTGGIPWEVWYRTGKLGETNFFPDLRSRRGNTTRDSVYLRKGHGMVDLLYFERPRNFEYGRPFFLTIHPKRWELPIRLRLVVQ